ncbi:eburicol 14 alpha-demethylase CYP51 [Coleophoma crateriformis]|uniref:Eburicol 14 alpha-demethylase CYP51 n=1 Tax=Coleophoma crateriformis TaxID=565419 RepID=A0A3D8QQM2_9HELO|nr:eburicol 14 alpha-demethylase CYP51 [Coleophoma crateriformis]
MGILENFTGVLAQQQAQRGTAVVVAAGFVSFLVLAVVLNVLSQLFLKNPNEPPVVFHWFPIIGSSVTYGMDPYGFFDKCKAKYGDIFTFILLGKKTTVYLGRQGNEFVLNGKLKDVNAEEIYTVLTTPFMKIGLTTEAFRSYVPIIQDEVENFIKRSPAFKGQKGSFDVGPTMAEITIYTASHSLQGKEVRDRFDSSFAALYHDLDMGFSPINFALHWAPLPHNRARDHAQRTVAKTYMEIIKARRADKSGEKLDIMWQLMRSTYKDGTPVPDKEIAHMMIALLMAGQHSSSSSSSWIVLRLAARPDILEELYQEQIEVLGPDLPALRYEDLSKLERHQNVLKEILRLHTPIHSIMRKVKSPMPVSGTKYVIPPSHVILASPGCTSRDAAYFPNPLLWDPHRWEAGSGGVIGTDDVEEEMHDYGYGLISKGASSPYLPFGAGRHRCIGEQFANVQLLTIMATLARHFKLQNPGGSKEVIGTDYTSLFSRPLTPAVVEWERREKS